MGLTLAGEVPDPAALPETALLLPRLPFLPFGEMGSEELAGRIAAALSEPTPSRWPRRSSSSATARSPSAPTSDQAVDRLELVEVLCRTWRDALLIRAATGRRIGIVDAPRPIGSTTEGA